MTKAYVRKLILDSLWEHGPRHIDELEELLGAAGMRLGRADFRSELFLLKLRNEVTSDPQNVFRLAGGTPCSTST